MSNSTKSKLLEELEIIVLLATTNRSSFNIIAMWEISNFSLEAVLRLIGKGILHQNQPYDGAGIYRLTPQGQEIIQNLQTELKILGFPIGAAGDSNAQP